MGISRKAVEINNAYDKPNIAHVAIVGSGPAGYSAAVYAARFNWNTVVFKGPKPGGLLTETSEVENWPGKKSILGFELMADMERHARSLGVQCVQDTIESVNFNTWPFVLKTQEGITVHALSVIIATGATPVMLEVKGEDTYWGRGITTCAKCDAFFYKGQDVVVVGGGDSAIEEAIQLAPYARSITILVRKDRMRAAPIMQNRLSQYPSISVMYNVEVKEILGDGNQVTGVMLWSIKDRALKKYSTNGVFLAIGHKPNTQVFSSSVSCDNQGYIKMVDCRSQKTSIPGIFAAGDVEDGHYRQAIVSAGSGVKAAIDANTFLTEIGLNTHNKKLLESHLFMDNRLSGSIKEIRDVASFNDVLAAHNVVVVDFFKDDCPQCVEVEPIFVSIAQEYGHVATFIKVNTQQLLDLSGRFHIYKVPSIMIFKQGALVARYSAINKDQLRSAIEQSTS